VKNTGLIVNGTLTKSAVASGAQLMAYSGFSASNYLEQPYNSSLDFGTGDFCGVVWATYGTAATDRTLLSRGDGASAGSLLLKITSTNNLQFYIHNGTAWQSIAATADSSYSGSVYNLIEVERFGTVVSLKVNGSVVASGTSSLTVTNVSAKLRIGERQDATQPHNGAISLVRLSATAPSADQIAKIYRDELPLFQANAQCTIDGTSSAVTALAYDEDTDLLHVGTSWGRTSFQGLKRVESSATSVGAITSIAAGAGSHISAGTSGRYVEPTTSMREVIRNKRDVEKVRNKQSELLDIDTAASQVTFNLPKGWKPKAFYKDSGTGLQRMREGSTKSWTRSFDGFVWSVVIPTAYATNTWVQIEMVRDV
jgi:hypothetical protein